MKILEYWLARVVLASLSITPLGIANALGRFYIRILDIAVPRLRGTALKNLEMAGFAGRERIVAGVFHSIARLLVSFARFPKITRENVKQIISYEGLENFEEALKQGRGVLIATAHLGNWELSAFAHAYLTAPMNIVVRPIENPRIDALVEERRALSGNNVIAKKDAARAILRALKQGEAVGILIDQNVIPEEGTFIDFFGTKACAGTAFVKLAHHSGAAVVPGFALWSEKDRRYILRFEPEVEMTGDVHEDTQRVHARLEDAIRKNPDQWLWIHRRWKTRPEGESPIY